MTAVFCCKRVGHDDSQEDNSMSMKRNVKKAKDLLIQFDSFAARPFVTH